MNLNFACAFRSALFLVGLFWLILPVQASTIGGYISYTPDPNIPNKILVTLTTYSEIGVTEPAYSGAHLYWGDGTQSQTNRLKRTILDKSTHVNIYKFEHVYAVPGNYTIAYAESNRNPAAVNIPDTNNKSLYFSTQIRIAPLLAPNHSPVLQANPVFDVSYTMPDEKITMNLAATDLDGDSLAYHLVPALQDRIEHLNDRVTAEAEAIQGYFIPHFASINARTGELVLENMPSLGWYNLVVQISEYRRQVLISQTLVDFTALVGAAENKLNSTLKITNRAELTIIADTIIAAFPNELLNIQVQFSDSIATTLNLSSYSDFLVNNKAFFDQSASGQTVTGTFSFIPDATDKKDSLYQLIFYGFSSNETQRTFSSLNFYIIIQDKTITGIKDKEKASLANAYPNPAEAYIIIEHPLIKTNHTLTVYNLTGKIIKQQPINNAANTRLTRLDIPQSGHFFYSISDDIKVKQAGRFIFK